MTTLVFYFRASITFLLGIGCIGAFMEGEINPGVAMLLVTLVFLLPLVRVLYLGQKLLPASSLKTGFTIPKKLAWARAVFGFLLAVAGASDFSNTNHAIGILLLGLFLLSPLSDTVFTYSQSPSQVGATPQWNDRMTLLVVIRSTGLCFILTGLGCYIDKEYIPGHSIIVIGILLVFIRQIRLLFKNNKASATPMLAATQDGQVIPVDTNSLTTSAPDDLAKLLVAYTALTQLPTAKKGPAYQAFLNELFSLYPFSAKSNFWLNDNEIEGSFELEGQTYILTARWQEIKSGYSELLVFNGKVEVKSTWARGIFISDAGFTRDGLETFARGKRTSIIGIDGQDLQLILKGRLSLIDAIKRKARRAVETNHSFIPLQQLV